MTEPKRILALTLARGGSKSVPRKNIRKIMEVPLIGYTIAEALRSQLITRYVVSTDDEEIRQVAIQYGAEATPSFFINGELIQGYDRAKLEERMDALLN